MSREANAIRDLAHAPHAYIQEALSKSQRAAEQLESELDALEKDVGELRRYAETAAKTVDLFYEFDGDPACLWEHVDALDDELRRGGFRPPSSGESGSGGRERGEGRGEGMLDGPIRINDRLIWEPNEPHAREEVMVRDIVVNADDEVWIKTVGKSGERWNDLSRTREACVRHPHPLPESALGVE